VSVKGRCKGLMHACSKELNKHSPTINADLPLSVKEGFVASPIERLTSLT